MIRQRGFTLVEMLVSILLFSVVSLAMVTILATATKLFRMGEAGRAASDEAMAVITALDDDLSRAVPGEAGGFWFCEVFDPVQTRDPAGNMVIAFVVRNPDPTAIKEDGKMARQLVTWWIENGNILHRLVEDDPGTNRFAKVQDIFTASVPSNAPPNSTVFVYKDPTSIFATGCLHVSVEVASSQPITNGQWCTESLGRPTADLYPTYARVTLVFAGGNKDAIRGTVIRDDVSNGILVSGISALPGGDGAMVRIGDPTQGKNKVEWVRYDTFAKGRLKLSGGAPEGGRRWTTNASASARNPGVPVVAGQTYSLTRVLNH